MSLIFNSMKKSSSCDGYFIANAHAEVSTLSHSKKGLNPGGFESSLKLFCGELPCAPHPCLGSLCYSGFFLHSKDMNVRLTGESKLAIDVDVSANCLPPCVSTG